MIALVIMKNQTNVPVSAQFLDCGYCTIILIENFLTAVWSQWTAYSSCSNTCGYGIKKRTRFCSYKDECTGHDVLADYCNNGACTSTNVLGI